MVAFSQLSLTPIVDAQGKPVVGARIEIFDAGTLTPKATYKDKALNTPHPRPILTSAGGRIPSIWTTGNDYRARITAPAGTLIDDIDGIQGDVVTVSTGGGGSGTVTADLSTGDVIWSYRTGTRVNFVRLNGRTIGSATSGASERANADVHDLFVFLWNGDPTLAVSGGRGATAEADWTANKTITLPDARFRSLVGLDDMGNTAAGRSVGATFGTGAGTTLGSVGGTAGETLLTSQIPSHSHTGSTSSDGNHSHSGATGAAGSHAHGGSTSISGEHQHTYTFVQAQNLGNIAGPGGSGGYWSGAAVTGGGGTTPAGQGTHSHAIGTDTAPAHAHTIPADGLHSHTFTTATSGGGAIHNNTSPFILGTWFMRL